MNGLELLNKRLNYFGGNQEKRMQNDKLRSLKKALLYSYQAATITLEDERKFRSLINPDKIKPSYDNKIISIPYNDICLNKKEKVSEKIGLSGGDVFYWDDTDTYWIVYLENLEEDAYFRAEIRRCKEEVEINNKKYKIYIRGPIETTVQWRFKKNISWNDLNYSLLIYITKDENTLNFFNRFKKIKINGKPWETEVVDRFDSDGILEIGLTECFNNSLEDEIQELPIENIDDKEFYIDGNSKTYPYAVESYKIIGLNNGTWSIDNNKIAKIIDKTSNDIKIEIISGKSGVFNLNYTTGQDIISKEINIESL